MSQVNLRRVDLNLLVVLDLLLEERHVTRAADRLALTQSAASAALGRLRSLFNDTLLVRSREGLSLTPRAQALQGPLRAWLDDGCSLLGRSSIFDPAQIRQTVRLGMPDYASMVLMPKLVGALKCKAPLLDVEILPSPHCGGDCKDLDTGKLDLAIAAFSALPDHLRRKPLLEDSLVCLMRSGHPAARGRLTTRKLHAYPGIFISGMEQHCGQAEPGVDSGATAKHYVVPHCLAVPAMLRESDSIAVVPMRLAAAHAPEMTTRQLPQATRPLLYEMAWHPRSNADPARAWLRGEIARVALEA